ncbi:MAG TPA: endonuclease [Flavobacterium sp.]
MKNIFYALLMLVGCAGYGQVVINELDSDNPSTDDREFIELRSETPNFPLDGYVLVLFNGATNNNRSYYVIDLDGYSTDINGLILIGNNNVSPVPEKYFPISIFQNGADGVAIYSGSSSDFPNDTVATSVNLIDALIYGTSDPNATQLMDLLGVTVQVDENINNLGTTQSIQRKNDGTYEVKAPTPGAHNDGSGVIFNGITISVNGNLYNEGDALTITFTTQTPVTSGLQFSFTLNNGSFNTSDFTGNTNVQIPSGSTSFTTTITLTDDSNDDGDELAVITFGDLPSGYNRLNDNIEIRVIDNDFTVASWGTPLNPTYGMVENTMPDGYYASLTGKAGDELKQAIQEVIANPDVVRAHNYGDAEIILKQADENPLNSNQVWLMYVEQPRAKYKFQTTASNVGSWNREHIYPQSRGGFAEGTDSTPDGINIFLPTNADDILAGHADAHHIRAEDGPENTLRSNRDYGSDYNGPNGNQGSWKGDVARAVFYMAVRYNALSVVNGNPPDTTVGQLGDLASLLAWNHQDPSDDFEMNRNNIIYTWQLNRNPFIDYPDLADYIWGANAGQAWFPTLSTAENQQQAINIYPNPASGYIIVSTPATQGEISIFSLSGAKLYNGSFNGETRIDLNLASGIYIAKITADGKTSVRKVVIK